MQKALSFIKNNSPIGPKPAIYWLTGICLTVGLLTGHNSDWRGSPELHTSMEAMATLIAAIVGVMALVRFYSRKNSIFLVVGAGFLGTSFLDGYHTIVTSAYFKLIMPSDLISLIPWSWVASRQFLSIVMVLSWLAWRREKRLGAEAKISERFVYVSISLFTILSFLFFAFTPLPRAYFPEIFFHRPEEFLPALLFLVALIGYLKKGRWKHDPFEHWLVLSLIVGLVSQAVFMSHSGELFDYEFDIAHTLKKISYVCVLTGLMISMYTIFRHETEIAQSLSVSERRLQEYSQELEVRVEKRTKELVSARDEAQQATEAKSNFLAVVSHEVRTPMNGVLGMARLLVDTELDPKQREFAETIVHSGESLLAILNDLLDISKLEAGKLEIEAIPLDPRLVVSDTVALMMPGAKEKGLRLRQDMASDLPPALCGDPHRLRQILLNLVSNAIKFTDSGDVTVRMSSERKGGSQLGLTVSVSDTGPGIPQKTQAKLFSPFTQGSVEVARKSGGTGLGLAICRRLADLMGGELILESAPGEGSCFTLHVPMEVASVDDIPDLKDPGQISPSSATPLEPLRVLLVEDDKVSQQVAEAMLEKQGHAVIVAENGEQAVARFEEQPFDVVLMDRHMPVMDGIEATRRIREMEGDGKTITIIGVTAAANKAEVADCLEAGMNEVIIKPVEPARMALAMAGIRPRAADGGTKMPAASEEAPDAGIEDGPPVILDPTKIEQLNSEYGEDLIAGLVGTFHETSRDSLARIVAASEQSDQIELQRQAHSLKGGSLTLGLVALSRHCRQIENACIEGEIKTARDLAGRLPEVVDEALKALS